ncbi:hypothetical protein ACMHYB_38705 [Sorangium sp. So ce1128]
MPLTFITIKPSTARLQLIDRIREGNRLAAELLATRPRSRGIAFFRMTRAPPSPTIAVMRTVLISPSTGRREKNMISLPS